MMVKKGMASASETTARTRKRNNQKDRRQGSRELRRFASVVSTKQEDVNFDGNEHERKPDPARVPGAGRRAM